MVFMKPKIILLTILSLMFIPLSNTYAKPHPKAGTTTASFLKVDTSAKVTSLGGAYVAFFGGTSSINYNPAGIIIQDRSQVSLLYNSSFQEAHYGFLSYLNSKSNIFSYSLSFLYSTIGNIREKEYDPTNPKGVINGRKLPAQDFALITSLAKTINNNYPNVSLGTNLKLIRCKLDNETALGLALDIGYIIILNPNISLGLSMQNLGTKLKYINEKDSLPLNLKVGTSISLLKNNKLLFLLDLNKPIDNNPYLNTGLQLNLFNNILSLRCGYASGPGDIGSGLSAGLGINIDNRYNLELSFTPYEELGDMIKVGMEIEY